MAPGMGAVVEFSIRLPILGFLAFCRMSNTDAKTRFLALGRTVAGHLTLAKNLLEAGQIRRALVEVDRAVAADPLCFLAHYCRGLLLVRLADLPQAAESLVTAVELEPTEPGPRLALAEVYLELADREAALATIAAAVEVALKHAIGHQLHGIVLEASEQPDEAIDAFRRAIKLNPQLSLARLKLASLLLRTGRESEATDETIAATRLNPHVWTRRVSLGDLLRAGGQHNEALAEYEAAAGLARPTDGLPSARVGETLVILGHMPEAERAFLAGLERDPRQFDCHLGLARLCVEQKRWSEAESILESVIELDANLPEAIELLEHVRAAQAADDS